MRPPHILLLLATLLTALPIHAATTTAQSATGPLETVPPVFTALTANPAQAARGEEVTLTFQSSEPLAANPDVTVHGNPAAPAAKALHTYTYWVSPLDPLGPAPIAISGTDALGNPGSLTASNALQIIPEPIAVPLRAWPLAALLLLTGILALALRRRGIAAALLALGALPAAMAADPVLSNIQFLQQPNALGTEVRITYDLLSADAPCNITVTLSKDGGLDGYPHPVTTLTGDHTGVTPGTGKTITWDIAADYPNEDIPNARLQLTADDGIPAGPVPPIEMIVIPAGSFDMGNSGGGDDATFGQPAELPLHTVTLAAYAIGKYEITNQQFCDVLNWAYPQGYLRTSGNAAWEGSDDLFAGGSLKRVLAITSTACNIQFVDGLFTPKSRTGLPGSTSHSMANNPVTQVTWHGAAAYANWLSEAEGLTPVYDTTTWTANLANDGYHLPTEAQWERAAAWDGTQHWVYGFTADTLTGRDRANYSDVPDAFVNPLGLTAFLYTAPVGWFNGTNTSPNGDIPTLNSPSPVGAYDMTGNVWEWCNDWYQATYYTTSPPNDPTGPATGTLRVIRGGSWTSTQALCRTARRNSFTDSLPHDTLGFRLAK